MKIFSASKMQKENTKEKDCLPPSSSCIQQVLDRKHLYRAKTELMKGKGKHYKYPLKKPKEPVT